MALDTIEATTRSKYNADAEDSVSALLEQYKLYVEMADRVSSRRIEVSKFYSTLMSGLLLIVPFLLSQDQVPHTATLILVAIGLFGISLCMVWSINIASYRQLNSLKFKVIHELELLLPFAPYTREWHLLNDSTNAYNYRRVSAVERYVPFILAVPYFLLLIVALVYNP